MQYCTPFTKLCSRNVLIVLFFSENEQGKTLILEQFCFSATHGELEQTRQLPDFTVHSIQVLAITMLQIQALL